MKASSATEWRTINHARQAVPQQAGQQVFNRVQTSRRNGIFVWLNQTQIVIADLVAFRSFFNRNQANVWRLYLCMIQCETFNFSHEKFLLKLN